MKNSKRKKYKDEEVVARRGKGGIGQIAIVIIFALLSLLYIFPLYYVVVASLNAGDPTVPKILGIIPKHVELAAYEFLLTVDKLPRSFLNSVIITVCGTALNMIVTTITAYVLSKKFPGKKWIMRLIVFTMFFSGGMIPYYLTLKNYPFIINNLMSMILPYAIQTYYLIIMITYFKTVPDSLEDAARIDGAGEFTILWKIVIPISKPTLAAIGLFYAVDRWNEWYNAMLFVYKPDKYPLQYLLREAMSSLQVLGENGGTSVTLDMPITDRAVQMAIVVVAAVPILCVYPFLQKYFASGVMIGSIKE